VCNVSIRKGEYVCIGDHRIREDFINLSELRDSLFSTLARVRLDNDLARNFNTGILPGLVSVSHAERSHFKYNIPLKYSKIVHWRPNEIIQLGNNGRQTNEVTYVGDTALSPSQIEGD